MKGEGRKMLKKSFVEVSEKNMPVLNQYVPIVARVHGGNHPEFHEVKKAYEDLTKNLTASAADKKEVLYAFGKIREITSNYTVPSDVCESYEAVYMLLKELDEAYAGEEASMLP